MDVKFAVIADGTYRASLDEETSNCRTSFRQTMEVETKSSSMAATIQVEVAEAMEIIRMDSAQ
ncbi:hypothetical protein PIB30_115460 [Stylosanthes scabra]|uniref:Uncharacterized protein n=1 Tax=Stylosanthes scabra TaxID=79078 RepID=A0ABU6Y1L0_9FABA|nr:hypothetical protein [Stylosanthes scabra]